MTDWTVVVPDATRPLDYREVLSPLFSSLHGEVTARVALGLHRPMTREELAPLRAVCDEFSVALEQHDPASPTPFGKRVVAVGVVEPHQYAGFSGGVKGLVIGCGSAETIAHMHSLPMLAACGARVGWFEGNPFQERLWELAANLPETVGWFVIPGHDGIVSGPVRTAFGNAVKFARALHFRPVDEPVSSMLLKIPATKATNFYQASRAATYVALAEHSAIRDGGTLYVEAACPEGVGLGAGELACARAMQRGREALLRELRSSEPSETAGGEQRAYVLAMALERVEIVLVGAQSIPQLSALGISQRNLAPPVDLVADDPFHALPVLRA